MIKKLQNRYTQLILVILFLMVLLAVRLLVVTVFQHERWVEASDNLSIKSVATSAPRGRILDRYGRVLAGNVQTFSVQFSDSGLDDAEINDRALQLIKIFEANGDEYNDNFSIVFNEQGEFEYTYQQDIDSWLDSMNLPLGLTAEQAFERLRMIYEIDETFDVYEAQEYLQNIYKVYPPISVRLMKYTADINKESFLQKYGLDKESMKKKYGIEKELSAQEAFEELRNKFEIDSRMSAEDARKIMVVRNELADMGYRQYMPATLATGISDETIVKIEELSKTLTGVDIVSETVRYYPNGTTASHILGYLGKISEANKSKYVDELGYDANDLIGQSGLESAFESTLKGTDGIQYVQVNVKGERVKVISETAPKKGNDLYSTIDLDLQKVAEDALEQALTQIQRGGKFESKYGDYNYGTAYKNATVGAAVAIEVETGDVLAMASYPDFDPNLFVRGINSQDWASLQSTNPRNSLAPAPLYNVAARSAIQPGSTFKMVTATAAMDQGLSPKQKLKDGGYVKVGNRPYNCLIYTMFHTTHGYVDLAHALEVSCNYYFYDIATGKDYYTGKSLGYDLDIDTIMEYAKQYGLGEPTGIEISETVATRPSAEKKMNSTKALLKYALNANAEKYFKRKVLADPDLMAKYIDEIVSWTEENPTRNELLSRMPGVGVKDDMVVELTDLCKYTYFNYAQWTLGDEFSISIGQGENAYTPLQMANYVATIGNDGTHNKVSLIKAIEGKGQTEKDEPTQVSITKDNLAYIIQGMKLVAQGSSGSLRGIFGNFPVSVVAKSGTADKDGKINWPDEVEYVKTYLSSIAPGISWEQVEEEMVRLMSEYPETYTTRDLAVRKAVINLSNGSVNSAKIDRFKDEYDPFAWVVATAPEDDPKIAVAVLLFQGGKAAYAAPVAREIIGEYLHVGDVYEEYDLDTKLQ